MLCLSKEELIDLLFKKEEDKLNKIHHMEQSNGADVVIACIFCAACQLFLTFCLLFAVISRMKNEDTGLITFTYVSWQLQLVRFICACICHFKFTSEIQ